jgi:single-strand DNA-binding protein
VLPRVHVEGRLTRNPELKFLQSGAAVASFGIACNDRRINKETNQWEDGETTFLDCSAWRETAEHVAESLHKGDLVLITGKLAMRKYTNKDNVEVTTYGVTVEAIGPALQWNSATVHPKAQRTQAPPGGDPWATMPQPPPQQSVQPAAGPQQGEWNPPQGAPPTAPQTAPAPAWGGPGGQPYGDEPPF